MKGQGYRRLARLAWLSLPLLGLGCQQFPNLRKSQAHSPPALAKPGDSALPIRPVSHETTVRPAEAPAEPAAKQPVPISLDSVLRLAEENNPALTVARAKVYAAFTEKKAADAQWIPDVFLGVGYFRHDGGIQLQEGPLIVSHTAAVLGGAQVNVDWNPRDIAFRRLNASRKVFQEQGELAKITNDQLLEASTTYIDLLAAHAALAVSRNMNPPLRQHYEKTKKAAEKIPGADLQAIQIEAEIRAQHQTQQKLQSVIESLQAKLIYSLGLDPNIILLPVDSQMVAFHLVDISPTVESLVAQALTNGPGVRELENILAVIQHGIERSRGAQRYLPNFNVQAGEGIFGAGPITTAAWANRFDLALQARWNLTEVLQAERKRNIAFAQMNQAAWTYQDLRAKLTLGVQESRATILYAGSQFGPAEAQIRAAQQALEISQKRLDNIGALPGVTYAEVLNAIKALSAAQLNYIDLIREFDKAQLRLLTLLGTPPPPSTAITPPPEPNAPK